jgi:hypothetical protein
MAWRYPISGKGVVARGTQDTSKVELSAFMRSPAVKQPDVLANAAGRGPGGFSQYYLTLSYRSSSWRCARSSSRCSQIEHARPPSASPQLLRDAVSPGVLRCCLGKPTTHADLTHLNHSLNYSAPRDRETFTLPLR